MLFPIVLNKINMIFFYFLILKKMAWKTGGIHTSACWNPLVYIRVNWEHPQNTKQYHRTSENVYILIHIRIHSHKIKLNFKNLWELTATIKTQLFCCFAQWASQSKPAIFRLTSISKQLNFPWIQPLSFLAQWRIPVSGSL